MVFNLSDKAEKIRERYQKGYVTDAQLLRYYELSVITIEEYKAILGENR